MYDNASHLMISGCFISALCIKMKSRHPPIKPRGRDEKHWMELDIPFHGGECEKAIPAVSKS